MVHPRGALRRVPAGDLRPGDHVCLLYASDEERTAVLRDLVRDGLDAQDKILYLAGPREPRDAAALLDQAGRPEGRVDVVPLREFLTGEGELEPDALLGHLRRAAARSRAEGFRALRVAGDLSAALRDEGRDECDVRRLLRYEALLGEEFGSGQALAVCQYDARRCDPAALDAVESVHARGVEADPLVRTAELLVARTYRPQGLRLEGVVDTAAHRQLRDALRSVAAVREDVRLEMSRVEFLDLGGLRLLMTFARARAARHRTVELAGLAPHLAQVITLIGWDRTPGLVLGRRGRPSGRTAVPTPPRAPSSADSAAPARTAR
ncbi:MEDS domain-containing protein [Streptomyces sp. AV19]|uniref:MEDS domain-containing protein n=1 Tax=Streptomyces sp. AV19 TaxID=2793068 RepID=UPI0018FECF38|nr:MEDS domain-containing protein [Streptomyces sp. AV19]MBH1933949.1 MEDS domain-containing protein [Streptomyces sp. AV19]MDG4535568.1 MEDS domain-containing protein [Streptomyces sp. AV19]